ncbi:hypothetical protein BDD21_2259 [Thiocapsa rosea]|uniref:Uncharacterized protein n=1 Tax=Thiocapsa rosea TaxID=69360 RepID=A0A495V8L0_9GAMM|nr:hypothetical protein BDD21_2259 [Thiocapsa rosea]
MQHAFKPRPARYAMFLDGIGPGRRDDRWSRRGLKYKNFTLKPRLAKIKEVSDAEHKTRMTHVALDAV